MWRMDGMRQLHGLQGLAVDSSGQSDGRRVAVRARQRDA
jgi:hypothetical protein